MKLSKDDKFYQIKLTALKTEKQEGLEVDEDFEKKNKKLKKKNTYLINGYNDDNYDKKKIINKKAKGTKKCVIKRRLMFKNYINSLFNDKIILQSQQRFKSDRHNVYTEQINKIALSSNDDKRLQTFDKITTYQYGTNAFKVCESKMMIVRDFFC